MVFPAPRISSLLIAAEPLRLRGPLSDCWVDRGLQPLSEMEWGNSSGWGDSNEQNGNQEVAQLHPVLLLKSYLVMLYRASKAGIQWAAPQEVAGATAASRAKAGVGETRKR